MTILAIDQSYTSSGIVVLDDDNILHAERFITDKDEEIYRRAWDITNRTVELAEQYEVEYIAIEGLAFSKFGNATRDLAGLQFVIICKLRFEYDFEIRIAPPKTMKKVATGSGNAKKGDLIDALPDHHRKQFEAMNLKKTTGLSDLADAYWIGKTAQANLCQ